MAICVEVTFLVCLFFALEPVCEQAKKDAIKKAGRINNLIRIARIFKAKVNHFEKRTEEQFIYLTCLPLPEV